jgi:CSLREA domain-containing protein
MRHRCFSPRHVLVPGALLFAALAGCSDRELATDVFAPAVAPVESAPVVNSLADPGDGTCDASECTLREALSFATAGATITFSVTGTIAMDPEWGTLMIEKSLVIAGPGAAALSVSGSNSWRVFSIYAPEQQIEISGLTIRDGREDGAGGINNPNAYVLLSNVVVTNNSGLGTWQGGGIQNQGTMTVRNSTISGNSAEDTGGGILNLSTLTVEGSTVSGNTASSGGGIHSRYPGTLTIINSTISGNSAESMAAGVFVGDGSTATVRSTTIANNTGTAGGGIVGFGTLSLLNSVVSGNGDPAGGDDVMAYNGGTASYSLVRSGSGLTYVVGNLLAVDPLLGPLADNGGPTLTHALLAGSPAIDAGTSDGCPETDQRGTARPQASYCDMGAYEVATGELLTPDFTFDLSALPATTYGGAGFNVAGYATSNSSGAITFATGAASVGCTVTAAGMVSIIDVAVPPSACTIEATLATDGSYAGAGPIAQSFNIAKAAGAVSISNLPIGPTVGGSFTPAFTTASDGTTSVESLTLEVCTVSGGVVSFVAVGTCTLAASVAEGTNHLAATGEPQDFTIAPAAAPFSSTCSYMINIKNGQRTVTVAWENADPGVTRIEVADGRVITKQMAPTASGSWSTSTKADPSYGIWGGTSRKDMQKVWVPARTACTP